MRSKAILILAVALCAMLVSTADSATITWASPSTSPARDFAGNPLPGQSTFGTPNLSRGALVQLWLAVGAIDNPFMVQGAYADTAWKTDDVLLMESHVGHGTFLSNAGSWSTRSDFTVNEGDIVYVRAYNLPKADWTAAAIGTRELGIANSQGAIVSMAVGPVINPQTLNFADLKTQPIPEPATLLLLAPGLALWAIRRKK
jgi:hypothetical protein